MASQEKATRISTDRIPNGAAAAALLSGSLGIFVVGLLTTLSEASASVGSMLNWYNPSGNLVGKTGLGIIVWLVTWVAFNAQWKDRDVDFDNIVKWTTILLALGFLLTFPPFFEIFK